MSISFFCLSPTKFGLHTYTSLLYLQISFYTMNKVLTNNIIIFYFCHYCYKSKKLECQEEIYIF